MDVETIAQKHVDTTNEGTIIVNNNSHEFNVFQAIDAVNGSSAADLNVVYLRTFDFNSLNFFIFFL